MSIEAVKGCILDLGPILAKRLEKKNFEYRHPKQASALRTKRVLSLSSRDRLPLLCKLIMRHIFLTGHGGPEVLIYLRDRLWPAVFGTNHCVHSNNYRARAGGFAGGVVAPDLWKIELAQPQR